MRQQRVVTSVEQHGVLASVPQAGGRARYMQIQAKRNRRFLRSRCTFDLFLFRYLFVLLVDVLQVEAARALGGGGGGLREAVPDCGLALKQNLVALETAHTAVLCEYKGDVVQALLHIVLTCVHLKVGVEGDVMLRQG